MSGDGYTAAYVRMIGVRLGRFVEFEYFLDDGTLSVELILPFPAFQEFCKARKATIVPPDEKIASDVDRLAWRAGQPGLLRKPSLDGGSFERRSSKNVPGRE